MLDSTEGFLISHFSCPGWSAGQCWMECLNSSLGPYGYYFCYPFAQDCTSDAWVFGSCESALYASWFGSAMSVEICSGQQKKKKKWRRKNRRKKRDYRRTVDNELALMSSNRTLEVRTESLTQRGRGASCSPSQAGSKTSTWRHRVNLDS